MFLHTNKILSSRIVEITVYCDSEAALGTNKPNTGGSGLRMPPTTIHQHCSGGQARLWLQAAVMRLYDRDLVHQWNMELESAPSAKTNEQRGL